MEKIMVVFSSTTMPRSLIDHSIELAKRKQAKLIILDVRDRAMSEKVAALTENIGFMGEKVVRDLKKDIAHERCDIIFRKLSTIEEAMKKEQIPYEIVIAKGPFAENIAKVAREKKVKTILCQRREHLPEGAPDFEVIHV
ncbi:MAG: universal stress protein [Methanobacteriota archaeon]|nr:MAG: universal stress protein [Euryarchaeota archaeon]